MNDFQKNFFDEIRVVAIFVDDLGVDCEKSMRGLKQCLKLLPPDLYSPTITYITYNNTHPSESGFPTPPEGKTFR